MKVEKIKDKDGKNVIVVEREKTEEEKKADLETRLDALEARVAALENVISPKPKVQ